MRKFRNTKKLLTLAMASSMVMASTVAFAADDPTATITITDAQGNEYKAFKLMDLITDDTHYSYSVSPKYKEAIQNAIKAVDATASVDTDKDIISFMETIEKNSVEIRKFADEMYKAIRNLPAEKTSTDGVFEADQGYYLIAETGTIAEGKDRTLVMLDTKGLNALSVTEKRGVPTLDKVIVEDGKDVKLTDLGLNDTVTYKLTGTMPANIADYGTYKYIMHDQLPEGVSFTELTSLTIDGVDVKGKATLVTGSANNHCSVEISFDDVKTAATITKDSKVVATYTAKLNADALVGNPGNQNTAHLEFSNDPYDEGSTENTPEDTAKVFTFAVVVNKVDKEKQPLAGAEFKLQKKGEDGEYADLGENKVEYKKNDAGTQFTFESLDVGEYKLVETKVPTGYNKADDVEFKITAEYGKEDVNDVITKMTVLDKDGNVIGETNLADENAIFSIDAVTNGIATTDIINTTGIKLPSTGSTGAIMIYCASGVAATVGIASFVVAKKRKKSE